MRIAQRRIVQRKNVQRIGKIVSRRDKHHTYQDEDGNITYNGVDTDGDGKPDVAPDVCKVDPNALGCDAEKDYRFVWGTDGSSFYNKKLSTPIGKELKVFVKAYEPYVSSQNIDQLDGVQAKIERGSFASNDAMLRLANGADDHENIEFNIPASGNGAVNSYFGRARHSGHCIMSNCCIKMSNRRCFRF